MNAVDYRGRTTLITGASSGLGAEFARQLAARGSDLVLVARREDRLKALAGQLSAAHGVAVEPIAMDLSVDGCGELLAAEVDRRGITLSSVINNAGFGTYGRFHDEDPQRLRQEVGLDVMAVVDISRAFIGRLRSRGEGVLVNVASMAYYQPVPNMAVYGASKAFVLSFTEALWQESHGTGLRVIALSPGATKTEFFDVVGTEDAAAWYPDADLRGGRAHRTEGAGPEEPAAERDLRRHEPGHGLQRTAREPPHGRTDGGPDFHPRTP